MDNLDFSVIYDFSGLLVEGLIATLQLTLICTVVSVILGIVVAVCRVYTPRPLSLIATVYTEVFRNIPPLVQLFFWYFASNLSVFEASVVGLSIFNSAYIAEAVRSGINSIPKTQTEAARSSGLTALQTILRIIIPQTLLRITPMLSNQFVGIIKDTSVAMTIGYAELTFQTQMIETITFRGFEAAVVVTILYVGLASLAIFSVHTIERITKASVRRN